MDGDRPEGDTEGPRNLVIGRLLLPAELEDLPLPLRERFHRPLDRGGDLVSGELLIRVWRQRVADSRRFSSRFASF